MFVLPRFSLIGSYSTDVEPIAFSYKHGKLQMPPIIEAVSTGSSGIYRDRILSELAPTSPQTYHEQVILVPTRPPSLRDISCRQLCNFDP